MNQPHNDMPASAPIGVFDSGVGGLSVVRELRACYPGLPVDYVADHAFGPYGTRSAEQIRERTLHIGSALAAAGASALVVACNTATAAGIEALREAVSIPVVGVEPAVKPAARASRSGRIAVMATTGTLASSRYRRLIADYADGCEVHTLACDALVRGIEQAVAGSNRLPDLVDEALAGWPAEVDQLVLGCTHYPLVREMIEARLGEGVQVWDTAAPVVRQLARLLPLSTAEDTGEGALRVWTTGDGDGLAAWLRRLWPVEQTPVRLLGR